MNDIKQRLYGDQGNLTRHARRRIAERGIRSRDLDLLLLMGDTETSVGGGCVAVSMSCRRQDELIAEGHAAGMIERAARVVAVQGPDGNIVTVLRPAGRHGRRYRRGWNSRRPDAKLGRVSRS